MEDHVQTGVQRKTVKSGWRGGRLREWEAEGVNASENAGPVSDSQVSDRNFSKELSICYGRK